jgi:small subunit ribosomal protein S4e
MHLTRKNTSTKIPIVKKGTKYIARASSDIQNAVPVLIALRDMLHITRTAKEVKRMIAEKLIKLNGRLVKDQKEAIKIFNVLEAGKTYHLSLLPTGKFVFIETKSKDVRLCKVTNRRLIKKGILQINLHDGSNVISRDKISVNDSLYLDTTGKIKKHVPLEKGKQVFVMSGRHVGNTGTVLTIENNKAQVKFEGGSAQIDCSRIIAL